MPVIGRKGSVVESMESRRMFSAAVLGTAVNYVAKLANRTVAAGAPFSTTASFTDPDESDRWTGLVDWGDGSRKSALTPSDSKRFALSHVFRKSGKFTVTVTVTDHFGKSSAKSFIVKAT